MAKKQQKFLGISKNVWLWGSAGFLAYFILKPKNTTQSGGTGTPPPTRTTSGSGLSTTPTVDGIYIGAIKISKNELNEAINYMFDDRDYSRDSNFEQLMYNGFLTAYYERDNLLGFLKTLNRIKKGGQSPFVSDDIKIVKKDISKLENSIISYYYQYKESKEDY